MDHAPTSTVLQDVLNILRQHDEELRAQGVQHLFVFGSVARGEHGVQSDIDLAVELQASDMGLMRLASLQRRLETLLHRKVDLISLSPHTKPQLADRLRKEAVRAFWTASDTVRDILDNIARIEDHMRDIDSLNAFIAHAMCRDAVERCLLRISEAAIKLGDTAEQLAPEIPWHDVRGMGNHLRHAYDLVDPRILWNTIRHELPQLKQACEQALTRLQG